MKTLKEYREELIVLDKEFYELMERIKRLKQEFIKEYSISEWESLIRFVILFREK